MMGRLPTSCLTVCPVKSFVHLAQAWVIREERISVEKMPPTEWLIGKSMGHFLDY